MMVASHHYKVLCVCYLGYSEQRSPEGRYLYLVHFAGKKLRLLREIKRFRK